MPFLPARRIALPFLATLTLSLPAVAQCESVLLRDDGAAYDEFSNTVAARQDWIAVGNP